MILLRAFLVWACVALVGALPVVVLSAGPGQAQSIESPDYEAWTRVATRAEGAIETALASDSALEALREEVASWRARFLEAQDTHKTRIATLSAQISALGAAPAEGESEPFEIADRRASLNEQLAALRSPVVTADEAYTHANGIIAEIDGLIRDRQTDALFTLGPSPLNVSEWPQAWSQMTGSLRSVVTEVKAGWSSAAGVEQFRRQLPLTLIYAAIALVLLTRGRQWMEALVRRLESHSRGGRRVLRFLVSLLQIVLPFLGLLALTQALLSSGLFGLRGENLIEALPEIGLLLIFARWLALQLYSPDHAGALEWDSKSRAKMRRNVTAMGAVFAIAGVLEALSLSQSYSDGALAVIAFPPLMISALILLSTSRVFLKKSRAAAAAETPDEPPSFTIRLLGIMARVAFAVALVAPVMALIGFMVAANALIYPTILSFVLIGLLIVLQRFTAAIYGLLTGTDDQQNDALVPVLIGVVLLFASLPLFALVWGARFADLTEAWTRFQEGFAIGDSRISPTDFLSFAVVFVIGYMLTRLIQGALRTSILPKTQIDVGGQNAIVSGLGYVGIFLAAVIAISTAGIDLSNLAIVAGALSVGIGFGLQTIVSNFVSGIILLIERPISEGDWIEVGGQMGYVRDISVRSTRIETFDRTDVIVPNADLVSGTVTNYTRGNSVGRLIVPIGVAYGSDTKQVEGILNDIVQAHPMVLATPAPRVFLRSFGADSLDFEMRAMLRDVNFTVSVHSDLNHEIVAKFAEAGIEIPFAQRDVWLRNPEALGGARAPDIPEEKDPS